MASHEELVAEMQKLEKLSHAARLKHAKKRRLKQLKKYQDWIRLDRQTSINAGRGKRAPTVVNFESGALLNDLVSRNDLIGVSKILEKGSDPNVSNADGLTPLHKCCIDNELEMAEVLMEHNVDLNARDIEGWTPLHAAAATGNIQMINLLVNEGASLVAINNDDKMPIDVAADGDIKYILQQKMTEAGYTDDVLEYIRASVPKTMLADLKDSVRNSRTLNLQDKYGASALHVAAANGYMDVLEFLMAQEGVDLDIIDNEGWTPFHAAVCWSQTEVMKKLAEKGAKLDQKNLRGETPYAIAEDPDVRQLILELKGQHSSSEGNPATGSGELDEEEGFMPRARRMSVKRISQQAKEEMAKQSIEVEASIRRTSMVQNDIERSMAGNIDDKAMSDEIAEDDDEAVALIRLKSTSVDREAKKARDVDRLARGSQSEKVADPLTDDIASPLANDSTKPSKFEISESVEEPPARYKKNDNSARPLRHTLQDAPFHKSRVPRKSVLKKSEHPIKRAPSTYDTTNSPSISPQSTSPEVPKSPIQQDRKCCVVM